MKISKKQLKQIIKEELLNLEEGPEYTHRNRVQQGSGVLSSKMASLVGDAYELADELELGRDETREVFMASGDELQAMTSPSDNPVTKLVIEQLKFLVQPGVLIKEIGQAMTAFDE